MWKSGLLTRRWGAWVPLFLLTTTNVVADNHGLRRQVQVQEQDGLDLTNDPILTDPPVASPPLDDNTIVGGEPAAEGEFPAFVVFEGGVVCGGSLISGNRVLTAGHCVGKGWPRAVRVGSTTFSNGEVVKVKCAVKHPSYITPFVTVVNDVAILKLETAVTSVPPEKYMVWNDDPDYPSEAGTPMVVVGFGVSNPNDPAVSETLQKVETYFVNQTTCQETYSNAVVRPDVHICGDVANKGDCNGDSGGPLMDVASGKQIGIVSFGYGGCASDYQDVYTKVSNYDAWIKEQLDDDTCPGLLVGSGLFTNCFAFMGYLANVSYERVTGFFQGTNKSGFRNFW